MIRAWRARDFRAVFHLACRHGMKPEGIAASTGLTVAHVLSVMRGNEALDSAKTVESVARGLSMPDAVREMAGVPLTRPVPIVAAPAKVAAESRRVRRGSHPGIRIAELRRARGWSQEYLAERAGVSFPSIGKIEQGKRSPSLEMLGMIADALAVSSADIVDAASKKNANRKPGSLPDDLPDDVISHPAFAAACAKRDLGEIFRTAVASDFTASHLARRCEMTVSQVSAYMWHGRHAVDVAVFDRVSDGLHIPGEMLGIGARPWQESSTVASGVWDISDHGVGINPLMGKRSWTRDDLKALSSSLDSAISGAATADVEMLAHAWLSADTPQLMELGTGRRISESLISTVERRVVQLRRTDDFVSGRTSHALVQHEISATAALLNEASLTQPQEIRLLAAMGELSQLAAFVAADAGLYRQAMNYAESGVLAAHAAGDASLAAHIISTLAYQLANTGDPRKAALLARTAYAGARRDATPTSKALFLDRIAWADAKSGDGNSCERTLGQAQENFSQAGSRDEPDWVYWFTGGEIDVMAGRCYTELRQPDKAEPLLRDAISAYDTSHIREIALYKSWLAEDYIMLNDLDAASEISAEILQLAIRADSARADDRLRHLANLLRGHKSVPRVAQFLGEYKETLASANG